MGSTWFTGGVVAAPRGRIQFDFIFNGVRYRPSIKRPPSEANLRRARERLESIKQQINLGIFCFEEEFPEYKFLRRVGGASTARLCSDVFDAYIAHCEARLRRNDMAAATVKSYRKILDCIWRPHLGQLAFSQIRYSRLITVADGHRWSKNTYNNTISVLKRAFVKLTGRRWTPSRSTMPKRSSPPSIGIGAKHKATTMSFVSSQA